MIVGPHRGFFFVLTAVMCSASLYGAELSVAADPLTRIFVGEPTRLTLPPSYRTEPAAPVAELSDCASAGTQASNAATSSENQGQSCEPEHRLGPGDSETEPVRPSAQSAAVADDRVVAQPASAGSAVEMP